MVLCVFVIIKGMLLFLKEKNLSLSRVFFCYSLWIGLLPPMSAYIGVSIFGWRLGIGDPIYLTNNAALAMAGAYYFLLLASFVVASFLTRWMAPTYGADTDIGVCAALVAVVGTPLMLGGLLHLYPLLPLNLLLLLPAIILSVYLLYTGLPVLLNIDEYRGMLMASALLGVFFVAAVSFAGLIMFLWVLGAGPDLGFYWRHSIL